MDTTITLENTFERIDHHGELEEMEANLEKRIKELKHLIEQTKVSRNKEESIRHMRNVISDMKRQLKILRKYKKNKQKEGGT